MQDTALNDTEPSPLLKPRRNWRLISTEDELTGAVTELAQMSGPFGVDAERASGFKYSQRAYLIQISRSTGDLFLIDPASISPKLSAEPFVELAKLLATAPWILHAATQDLNCLAEIGLRPTAIIDTELGSRIAGLPRVGLGAVVEHFLGLSLAKEHSAVDWSTRPLSVSWLEYAALDVDVLHELADALLTELAKQGKTEKALEEFAHLLAFKPKPEKVDKWRGLTGLHEVKDQRGLAVARALWQAREALGAKLDVAPGRLIPDLSISHVAKKQPSTRPELAGDRAFNGRASRSYLDTWWEAVEVGLHTKDLPPLRLPASGIPNHRIWPNKFPEAHKRLMVAKEVIAIKQAELNIPAENLLTPDFLRQLVWSDRESFDAETIATELKELGARNWQAELLAEDLSKAIELAPEWTPPTEPEASSD